MIIAALLLFVFSFLFSLLGCSVVSEEGAVFSQLFFFAIAAVCFILAIVSFVAWIVRRENQKYYGLHAGHPGE